MSKQKVDINKGIAVEFLATTLAEMREAGLQVAIKNVPARDNRPAGIILYVGEVTLLDGNLSLVATTAEAEPAANGVAK